MSAASETVVTGLFRQVLLRDPGPKELARFSRSVDAGVSEARVAARLYDSNEFRRDVLTSYI
ncbi:hypothetical protein [Paludisphaera soli]|uniref:hypothetical protein n=1 Tax=Paludisphaera soli TaxID=2712865 RepID=UPI0013EDE6F2|nr:hypothetical protein [Paludisphaera soli]